MQVEQFWERVVKTEGCWEYTGPTNAQGYGRFQFEGKSWLAHRLAWHLVYGEVPDELDHVKDRGCTSRRCVRLDHLEGVTHRENVARGAFGDKWRERAEATHCKQGHELTPENTYVGPRQRDCRTCRRERSTRYNRKKGHVERAQYLRDVAGSG
jgi:hypothetical protein